LVKRERTYFFAMTYAKASYIAVYFLAFLLLNFFHSVLASSLFSLCVYFIIIKSSTSLWEFHLFPLNVHLFLTFLYKVNFFYLLSKFCSWEMKIKNFLLIKWRFEDFYAVSYIFNLILVILYIFDEIYSRNEKVELIVDGYFLVVKPSLFDSKLFETYSLI